MLTPTRGTPLIWGSLFYLLAGNFFIGSLESLALSKIFGLNRARTTWRMVGANYASAWVGGVLVLSLLPDGDIHTVKMLFWAKMLLAWVLTSS